MIWARATKDVTEMAQEILAKWHPELEEYGVTFDLLFVTDDHGRSCLKLGGYPCAAVVRSVPARDRVKGCADIEITIDGSEGAGWPTWGEPRQRAVLDHEIYHVELVKKHGSVETDCAKRPKTRLRLHDWQMGGFDEIAKRHKEHSAEVFFCTRLMDDHGQYLFRYAKKGSYKG